MFGNSYYIRSRLFNNRYKVVGIMAGFYLLQGLDKENNWTTKKTQVPIWCAKLFYRKD